MVNQSQLQSPQLQSQPTSKHQASAVPSLNTLLDRIQIVMINTTLPANIGSAARAMHTMGLSHLSVVAPKLPIDDTSTAHAAGGKHILDNCRIVDTLKTAIADSQLVFAASSRNRHIPRPVVTPTQAGDIIKDFVTTATKTYPSDPTLLAHTLTAPSISILFGREDRGLTNDELAQADYHIQIDANPDYPVLNVASAIQVIASFLYANFAHSEHNTACQSTDQHNNTNSQLTHYLRQQWDAPPITQAQQQQLQQRIIEMMKQLSLLSSDNPDDLRDLPNRLARLSSRLQLDQKEYELLNAIVAKIKRKI